jgi:hypothetical protein
MIQRWYVRSEGEKLTSSVAAALPLAQDLVVGRVEEGGGAFATFFVTAARISSATGSFFLLLAAGAGMAVELLAESA